MQYHGIPEDEENRIYQEAAKARRIAEGKDFQPQDYNGPKLQDIFSASRAAMAQAEKERLAEQKKNPPAFALGHLPPGHPLVIAAKQKMINPDNE